MSRKVAAVTAVAFVLGAAGCGGSSSSQPGQPKGFAQQAAAVCTQFRTQVNTLERRATAKQGRRPSTAVSKAFLRAAYAVADESLKKLEALTPPAGQQQRFTQFKAAWKAEIEVEKQRAGLKPGRPSPAAVKLAAQAIRLGQQTGIKECA